MTHRARLSGDHYGTLLGWLLKQTFNTQPWVAEHGWRDGAIRAAGRHQFQADRAAHVTGRRVLVLCPDPECLCVAHGARRLGAVE